MVFKQFKTRRFTKELMDEPTTGRADLERAFYDIQWVNRHLNGIHIVLKAVKQLIGQHPRRSYTVLDMGTGTADIPMALVEWGRRQGIAFKVTGVDCNRVAIALGRRITSDYPEIELRQADALHLEEPDQHFDFVINSLFLHHLTTEEAVRMLREMARLSRLGFVVSDLQRHPVAYWAIHLLSRTLGRGSVFRHDAPRSVLNAFTYAELEQLKAESGLKALTIRPERPFRFVLTWQRQHEQGDN